MCGVPESWRSTENISGSGDLSADFVQTISAKKKAEYPKQAQQKELETVNEAVSQLQAVLCHSKSSNTAGGSINR
jgi:hypothetical protein